MSGVIQLRVSNGLCVVGTKFVLQTKSACVGWVCNVGSLELYSIQNRLLTGMQYGYDTLGIIFMHLLAHCVLTY